MNSKLETFDNEYGEVVLNALAVYAERMREVAQKAQAGANGPEPAAPQDQDERDLRKWDREDLLVLARAAGMLWHSTSREDPLDLLSARQLTLLGRAESSYLLSPEQAAEDGARTISVRPTPRGFAGMARAFTEAADKADAAHKAYEHLTGRDEDYDDTVDEH